VLISSLHVYPLKSARGISLREMALDDRGAAGDRRWMVTDEHHRFLSQREIPRLALLVPAITTGGLRIEAPGMAPLEVPTPSESSGAESVTGRVWDGETRVLVAHAGAGEWLSRFLGCPCRLVYQPDDADLPMAENYAGTLTGSRQIALTDGSPLLVIGDASLDDLNTRLATPLPMNRFRPNIVVRGAPPYEEDTWQTVRAGGVLLEIAKSCPRCATTTVDQATGIRGQEPLRTLATYRRNGSDVYFGQNATHHSPGRLRVGDQVEVVSRRP
jgi:MOSC domain-containing protein